MTWRPESEEDMDCITTDRARLYCGDCFRVLEELPERDVDGVIIAPPYSGGGTFSTMRKGGTYFIEPRRLGDASRFFRRA